MFLLDDNLLCIQGAIPPKPIMHIVYSPYFHKIYKSPPPIFVQFMFFCLICAFLAFRILTMMHLRIMLYTY